MHINRTWPRVKWECTGTDLPTEGAFKNGKKIKDNIGESLSFMMYQKEFLLDLFVHLDLSI